jgi:predicted RNA-binding Zn-ribbon protein involved in translation (DUF1610 family)
MPEMFIRVRNSVEVYLNLPGTEVYVEDPVTTSGSLKYLEDQDVEVCPECGTEDYLTFTAWNEIMRCLACNKLYNREWI